MNNQRLFSKKQLAKKASQKINGKNSNGIAMYLNKIVICFVLLAIYLLFIKCNFI
jgi:hypothetical protein